MTTKIYGLDQVKKHFGDMLEEKINNALETNKYLIKSCFISLKITSDIKIDLIEKIRKEK